MSRTRRILSGTGIGYAQQAATAVVGLWLTPFLLARIGQHQLGLWLVVGQVLGYLGLMELGVITILPREVAFLSGKAAASGDGSGDRAIAALIAGVRRIVGWQRVALAVVSALVWLLLPGEWRELRGPLVVVFATFVVLYPMRVSVAALLGVQEFAFVATVQFVGWALSVVATIALVVAGAGLYALVVSGLVLMAVPNLAATLAAARRWPGPKSDGQDVVRPSGVSPYFKRSAWVSVGQIANVLLNGTDLLILGQMLGPAAIVPYACTGKLVTVFANHPQLLMHAAQPALSELRMSESRSRIAGVATALMQAMLMMSGAIAVVVLPINHFFVQWWVGPSMYAGWTLTLAMTLMMVLRHWNVATVQTLFCFGYERQISLTAFLDGVVTTLGTVLLVWRFGFIGAPIASIASVLLISLPVNLRSVAHEMHVSTVTFIGSIAPLLAGVCAIGAVASLAAWWTGPQRLVSAAALLAPVILLYLAVVIPFAWYGPVGPYLRNMLAGRRRPAAAAALADSRSYT